MLLGGRLGVTIKFARIVSNLADLQICTSGIAPLLPLPDRAALEDLFAQSAQRSIGIDGVRRRTCLAACQPAKSKLKNRPRPPDSHSHFRRSALSAFRTSDLVHSAMSESLKAVRAATGPFTNTTQPSSTMNTAFDDAFTFESLFPSAGDDWFSSALSTSALVAPDAPTTHDDLLAQMEAYMAEYELTSTSAGSSPTASTLSPASSSASSVATPLVETVALADAGISAPTQPKIVVVDVFPRNAQQKPMPTVQATAPVPAQYDARTLAMIQRQQHAEATMRLRALATYFAQFGVFVPISEPLLMPVALAETAPRRVCKSSPKTPKAARTTKPVPVAQPAPRKAATKTSGVVRTSPKARAAPYAVPSVAMPSPPRRVIDAPTVDGEAYFRALREHKEKRKQACARLGVPVPSVLGPAPPVARVVAV